MPSVQSTIPSNPSTQPVRANRANWLRAPQRLWLRRALFQIHLWLGIAVTLYAVVIGLSGSVMVFKAEIEQAIDGSHLKVHSTGQRASLAQTIAHIQAGRPDWVAVGLRDFQTPDHAAMLILRRRLDPANTNLKYVFFDPGTGDVLLEKLRYDGILGWLSNLHYFLLLGRTGLLISGWFALALLLLSLSGVVLWWPGIARWTSALLLRRRASWRRVNWDLHSVVGFWSSAALIAVSFTGVYFAFPIPTAGAVVIATRGSIREALKYVALPRALPVPAGTPMLSIDDAVAKLNAVHPADAPASYLQLAQRPTDVYASVGYYPGVPYAQLRRVAIDPHTGAVLLVVDTHSMPFGLRMVQYFHAVHFGSFGGEGILGIAIKILWCILGLVPSLLAVTGLLMYWNRKLRPMWAKARR